jgi:transcriptional regulator with XRE-family HTH domain
MDAARETTRRQVERMLRSSGLDPTTLARRAGLAPSTLTRFLNKPVNYILSTSSLLKLAAVCPACGQAADPVWLAGVGRRMRQAREAIAPQLADEVIADLIGWSVEEFGEILDGHLEPVLSQFNAFANRLGVTTDFLLSGAIEGLGRRNMRLLLQRFPELLGTEDPEDIAPGTDSSHGAGRRHRHRS